MRTGNDEHLLLILRDITGGASGIGLALVNHFLAKSYKVLLLDLSPAPQLLEGLRKRYPGAVVEAKAVDVTNFENMSSAFAWAKKEWGRIDVVHAVAGISQVCHL
jgi:NAD(P)-dependent dehydrogenase (short-subunit alcohol dehydrogenase family)